MLKKLIALAMAVMMLLMCAAVQADAATNTPLETALNTFTEKYADNDSSKIEIQNVYMLTALLRQDYDPSAVLEIVRRTLY